jgi:small subunit ribosomal protein S20
MAITRGAKKAHRQSLRKKIFNDARKDAMRRALKNVRLSAGQAGTAKVGDKEPLAAAYKAIDKAYKRGVLSKNTAARRKAKVARTLGV